IFSQLNQICHNIQSLRIQLAPSILNELKDLISVQKILKHFYISNGNESRLKFITSLLTKLTEKHSDTLIKLELYKFYVPLSFIAKFKNLQELKIIHDYIECANPFKEFKELPLVSFPRL